MAKSLQGLKFHIIKHDCFCYSDTIYLKTEKKSPEMIKEKLLWSLLGNVD